MRIAGGLFVWMAIGVAGACQRAISDGSRMSSELKRYIVDTHNSKRQAVANGEMSGQPPAGNMLEMKWDDELAIKAQSWASSCESDEHDPHRRTKRFSMGQNIAAYWTSKKPSRPGDMLPDFGKAINDWFVEVERYKYGKFSGFQSCGHYTQMIWAKTYLIGCGYAFYYDPSKGYTKNYVCNYGPSGNILSRTPYDISHPSCRNYKLDFSQKWPGLCAQPSEYNSRLKNQIP